jgi:hypothetical protein
VLGFDVREFTWTLCMWIVTFDRLTSDVHYLEQHTSVSYVGQ